MADTIRSLEAKTYLDLSEAIFLHLGKDEQILYINKKGRDLLGLPEEEIIGKNWFENFVPISARDQVRSVFHGLMMEKSSPVEFYENPITTAHGEERIISWHNVIARDPEGFAIGTLSSGIDISDLSKTKNNLSKTTKHLKDIRQALDESSIVAITDHEGVITYVNEQFCKISKYSREELVGKTHKIVNSGFHSKEFFKSLWATISSGKVWKGEIRNQAKDGSFYWVLTTIIPFLDASGHPEQYIAIRKDITKNKENEHALRENQERLHHAEKMASLGETASGIAHELGNPLATIKGRIEFLELQLKSKTASQEEILRTLRIIDERADYMHQIIDGIRNFARKTDEDPFELVSVNKIIDGVLAFSYENFQKSEITLRKKIPSSPISIQCREAEISQILVNLINNAKDAVIEQKESWIEIELVPDDQLIQIFITNSGPKISKELQDKIMKPFFTTKAKGKGTGLGLSISNKIAETHGGTLELDKTHPFTRFILTLPKHPPITSPS